MNTYQRIKSHIADHAYKKGKHKGDAPAGERRMTHFRLVDRGDHVVVHMWRTDIVRAYPDGKLVIDCGGWLDSHTTKIRLSEALRKFALMGYDWGIPHVRSVFSYNQPCVRVGGKLIRYYDGITLQEYGQGKFTVTSELRPFEAKRINRTESKELHDNIKESGFKDMFKILHATSPEPEANRLSIYPHRETNLIVTNAEYAGRWADMVQSLSWERTYDLSSGNYNLVWRKIPASSVWSQIMNKLKGSMYETVKTTVYEK
jgi:hypothetical protein